VNLFRKTSFLTAFWAVIVAVLALLGGSRLTGATPAPQGTPNRPPVFAGGETLKFRVLWPSGLSLGEAILSASFEHGTARLEMILEADLPIHNLSAKLSSTATEEGLCSLLYHKKTTEGPKASDEDVEFDQKAHLAKRTMNGQISSLAIPECARDPLTFLYYFRNQLAAGLAATPASIYLGPEHGLEIRRIGPEKVVVGGRERSAEKFSLTYRRPRRASSFDLWFSSDSRREPLLVRLPSSLATFSAELE
jgi:uncharacterized protein DUF3108